jgi:hypothetical protein
LCFIRRTFALAIRWLRAVFDILKQFREVREFKEVREVKVLSAAFFDKRSGKAERQI